MSCWTFRDGGVVLGGVSGTKARSSHCAKATALSFWFAGDTCFANAIGFSYVLGQEIESTDSPRNTERIWIPWFSRGQPSEVFRRANRTWSGHPCRMHNAWPFSNRRRPSARIPRVFLLFEYLVRVTIYEADDESHSRPQRRSTINPTPNPRRSAKHTGQAHISNRQPDNDQYDEAKKQKRSFGRLVARAHAHHLALASCIPSPPCSDAHPSFTASLTSGNYRKWR